MERLNGKTAVITGASSGMGKDSAIMLAKEGANVVMVARRVDRLKETEDAIKAFGGSVIAVPGDASKPEDWQTIVQTAVNAFGTVDILVNNAGTSDSSPKLGSDDEFNRAEWDRVFGINLYGAVYGTKAVLPYMKKQGKGSIINIASISAICAMGSASSYTASKGAVVSLTRALAKDLAPFNIRANCILPGIIDTEMTHVILSDPNNPRFAAIQAEWQRKIKLPFVGEGSDIGHAVVFLASDESRYITGTELCVDGGYVID